MSTFSRLSGSISRVLKPVGFEKREGAFVRSNAELQQVISLRKSKTAEGNLKVTLDIGIWSSKLAQAMDQPINFADVEQAHWRQRIGHCEADGRDRWWMISEQNVDKAAAEINEILSQACVPTLNRISSDDVLIQEWLAGRSPGLTELHRLASLAWLLRVSGRVDSSEMHQTLNGLRGIADSSSPTRYVAAAQLKRLLAN